jgi:hypothetical protein
MDKATKKIMELLADTNFFQITVFADLEIDGKIYKDKEQKNNDSFLTPKNWEQHKETFFTQRMATYSDSYTLAEKMKLEVSRLEKLPINKTDYKILKDRYKTHLEQKQALPPQQKETITEQPNFTNNFDNNTAAEIFEYFKVGLVNKGYLTEQELNEYLKAAFELKTTPEPLFRLKHTPSKQKIYTVFYVYYKDISQKKYDRQKEYAALLGDYFEGYKTETIRTNWARDYKVKR